MREALTIEIEFKQGEARIWEWMECDEAYRVTCLHSQEDLIDEIKRMAEDYWCGAKLPDDEHE